VRIVELSLLMGGSSMSTLIKRFIADESGATAIEYGLIASLISIAIIAAAKNLGTNVKNTFSTVAANVTVK
jgi:pilus assembly protein Flp/PilA